MFKKINIFIIICFLSTTAMTDESPLTPADFGLSLTEHGQIDFDSIPPNVLINNFNGDCYPDILRWQGDRMELFIFQGNGYSVKPSAIRCFDKPVESVDYTGHVCDPHRNLKVTLIDGTEENIPNCGYLQLERENNYFKKYDRPPARVCETDFQIVWESEPRPYGMRSCAVGDLDNDGIMELATWWKENITADTAWILIYKCTGDDQYELFMEEFFFAEPYPFAGNMLITDIDQNGQSELIYTCQEYVHVWEFSAPGEYRVRRSNFSFARAAYDGKVCDFNQNGILDLAYVACNNELEPETEYMVYEYSHKTDNYIYFDVITHVWLDRDNDCQLDVGDFDNDGAIDIVTGNFSYWGFTPFDILYFRYDSSQVWNITEEWLYTGEYKTCSTPVVADLDEDGENELYAGGIYYMGGFFNYYGSAFIWESTGPGSGYISWMDTTNLSIGANETEFGYFEGNPTVLNIVILWINMIDNSQLYLAGLDNSIFSVYWQSPIIDSVAYHNPGIIDMDFDNKVNICLAGSVRKSAHVWEQVSTGIVNNPNSPMPYDFYLYPNYPNPFNDMTKISYMIKKRSDVSLNIYNTIGQNVLHEEFENMEPGEYDYLWDAGGLSAGIYIITLNLDEQRLSQKAVLLK